MLGNKSKSLLHFHFIVFIFGFTAILGSLISVNSYQIVWFRVLIAALTIIVVIKILKKSIQISLSQLLILVFCGFLISLHWVFFFKAIKVSNVSVTLSILSLGAFITFILLFRGDFSSELIKITQDDLLWLLILGTICTAYAFVISVDVMKHLSPYTIMISINMEPIYGMLLAYLLLGDNEKMSSLFYVGFFLIFFSVIMNGYLKLRVK